MKVNSIKLAEMISVVYCDQKSELGLLNVWSFPPPISEQAFFLSVFLFFSLPFFFFFFLKIRK